MQKTNNRFIYTIQNEAYHPFLCGNQIGIINKTTMKFRILRETTIEKFCQKIFELVSNQGLKDRIVDKELKKMGADLERKT